MTDPPADPPDSQDPAEDEAPEPARKPGASPFPALQTFLAIQRQLASVDFGAITAAQRMVERVQLPHINEIIATHDAISKNFASSIDFSRLTSLATSSIAADIANAAAVRAQWANSLVAAIDLPSLRNALAASEVVTKYNDSARAVSEALLAQARQLTDYTIDFAALTANVGAWIELVDRWLPGNLRDVGDLAPVADIALNDGIPLSWIPRSEIVVAIVDAASPDARSEILTARRGDILDDCEAVLADIPGEWAVECLAAVAALRAGLDGPGQSHASNIIDSVVLALHGKRGRDTTRDRAQEDIDDLPLQIAAENLTLRPLFRAFTTWFPSSGTTPPDYFARHPTAHAVGHPGIFGPLSSLIAVMLATSLTVQYSPREMPSAPTDDAGEDS